MPLYDFRCEDGHAFERLAKMDQRTVNCDCGKPAARLPSAAGLSFKGRGFHTTDYGRSEASTKKNPRFAGGLDLRD